MFKTDKTLWLFVVALVALAGLFASPAQASDPRLVAHIDEPFEVNGELYPAGVLRVREIGDYSPAATLNEIIVDGKTLGVLLAHERGNVAGTRDELIFGRHQAGHLVLIGVSVRGEPTRDLYRYANDVGTARRQAPVRQDETLLLASTK